MRADQSSASSLFFTRSKTQPIKWCHLCSGHSINTTEKNSAQTYPKTNLIKTVSRDPFPGDSVLYQVDKRPSQNYSNLVILLLIRSYWCLSPGCAVCAVGPLTSAALSTSFQQLPVPIGQFILTVCIWGLMHVFWFHQWCSLVYITYCLCSEWFFKRRWEYGQIYNIVKLQVSRKSLKMVFF